MNPKISVMLSLDTITNLALFLDLPNVKEHLEEHHIEAMYEFGTEGINAIMKFCQENGLTPTFE